MGRFKGILLERDENNHANMPDKLVAAHLIKNKLVREFACQHSIDGVCDYCGEKTKVLPLSTIVEEIDKIIMEYYGDPDDEGGGLYFSQISSSGIPYGRRRVYYTQ